MQLQAKAFVKRFFVAIVAAVMLISAVPQVQVQSVAHAAVKTLKQGDKGSTVRQMQNRLKKLGYYTGSTTSTFSSKMKSAVKAFQKANGLSQTGTLNAKTQEKLKSNKAISKSEYTKEQNKTKTLKQGSKGTQVKTLQNQLKKLGYFAGSVTGTFGSTTKSAVKAFQKANGLSADGIAGKKTRELLNSGKGVKKSDAKGSVSGSAKVTTKTLKPGNTGAQVKILQQQLKDLGYFSGVVKGNYYGITKSAVKDFQKANGLTANGIANQKTRELLNSGKGIKKSDANKADKEDSKANTKTLKSGSSGAQVKILQKQLKDLGYFNGKVAGNYLSQTKSAVKNFQKANGISADGIAGKKTRELLNSGKGVKKSEYDLIRPLKQGDKGAQVKKLQQQLKELNFFNGSVNGTYGSSTKSAVKAFQKANDLTANGTANTATRRLLNSGKGVKKGDEKPNTKTLKQGNSGTQVKLLQKQLKDLGFFTGTVGGNFGSATKTAVKNFQKANKLTANGVANAATRKLLNDGKGLSKKKYEEQQAVAELKKGDKGEQVKKLQQQLKKLGFFTGSVGGNYGSTTVTAVKNFQKANGLSADGIAGTDTRKLLNSGKGISKSEYDKKQKEGSSSGNSSSHPSHNSSKVEKVISAAKAQLGKRYVWGANGPSTFDCSGLTVYAFRQAGISLGRTAYTQGYNHGKKISKSQLKRGDLVFFNTISDNDLCDHVGIYLGGNEFIHASSGGGKVMISSLTGYYSTNFSWGRCVW